MLSVVVSYQALSENVHEATGKITKSLIIIADPDYGVGDFATGLTRSEYPGFGDNM
jgi:hypothetical protein